MAETKADINAIEAVEHPHHAPGDEDSKGRDFTIDEHDLPAGYFKSMNFIGSMFAIGAGLGAGVGAFAFVSPVLGIINADIGPSVDLTWVYLAYMLTGAIGLAIIGRLSDTFGRRWFFISGSILATIGSIVCATAQNIGTLIAGEALLGLATSTQLSYGCESMASQKLALILTLIVAVSEIVPMKWRFLAQAYA
jgi:MFS family permease